MSKRVAGAVVLAALALVAAGCGGGSDTSAPTALSKAEYVKQANAICREGQQKREAAVNEFVEEHEAKPGESRGPELIEVVLPTLKETFDELSELPAPKGDEDTVAKIIEAYEEPLGKIEENPGVALGYHKFFYRPDELAVDYGLEDCVL
jgi:hypothetical protein